MLRYFGQEQLAQCANELTTPKPYIPPSFFADHNIDSYVLSFFRSNDAQVTIARDVGLAAAWDDVIFDVACKRKQVIVTYDHDFLDFARFNVSCGPGLIILPARGTEREPRLARQKLDAALSDLSKFLFNPAAAWASKLIHFDKKEQRIFMPHHNLSARQNVDVRAP